MMNISLPFEKEKETNPFLLFHSQETTTTTTKEDPSSSSSGQLSLRMASVATTIPRISIIDYSQDPFTTRHSRQFHSDDSLHLYHKIEITYLSSLGGNGFNPSYPSHLLSETKVTKKDYSKFIGALTDIYFMRLSWKVKMIIVGIWLSLSLIALIINLGVGFGILLNQTSDKTRPYWTTCVPAITLSLIIAFIIGLILFIKYLHHLVTRMQRLHQFIDSHRDDFLKIGIELNIVKDDRNGVYIDMQKITNEREDRLIRMFNNKSRKSGINLLNMTTTTESTDDVSQHSMQHAPFYSSKSLKSPYMQLE
ncbi:hypothetical protein FDP41_009942 [Naegleria fowleri]|uniref:Uncharacterized protein n=1 Tax=Naegleria fowleri TaxID=5763 RepID=A0A6A5BF79_NAEFO|nr:uncharacterized protein FDP41_009942 [Naegleria fowleri]KAF0971719.1 hypothetical protein FDP41_009942 [Naegleria fowleri]CAG4711763.1 unnamed protein product [Naegleria fowleri]